MQALLLLFFVPFILLNLLGGVVGGIWLALLGEWRLLFLGILYMFGGAFLAALLIMPGIALALPAMWGAERRSPIVTVLLGSPAIAWTFAVMAATCILVFAFAIRDIDGSPIPYVLWGYAVALTPWSYMTSVESRSGNDAGSAPLFFCQLGTIAMMVAALRDPFATDLARLCWWFIPFAVIGFAVQLLMAVIEGSAARRES